MPFARNAWYVAALPAEVTDKPLGRKLLGEPIVLYRTPEGTVAALLDLCPHRFAPLSMGMLVGGHLQCPYHGLEFDGAGRCTLNPHGNGARPASLNVRAFPTVERDDLVWIWMGEAADADPALIPDYSCRIAAGRRTIGGHMRVDCNYRLLVDNLMDLGHAQYVHRANAQSDAFDRVEREVVAEDRCIQNLMKLPGGSPTVFVSKFLDVGNQTVDLWNDIRWYPVSAMLNFIAFAISGTPKEESMNSMGTHIVTPETDESCHYFYGASRNFAIDDLRVDDDFRAWQRQALLIEDKPMVEAIEGLRAVIARHALKPAMLACDEAAVRVSRRIDAMERETA
ncbi:aromatic ring-hydroxylating dioxygenase subunit alpha [Novosphingobium terrae]|uniref:aromatic ring-hydroxylating dioxygenase subunit alpha n=1 Tax=Novosphingobium terrae TaxID=2726189 RepID=UPI00197D4AB8|nr:aromatic ring-hydroxylating dioxygenase subunit alpha [Novosphingobium terrae]